MLSSNPPNTNFLNQNAPRWNRPWPEFASNSEMKLFWEQMGDTWCLSQRLSGNRQIFEAQIPAQGGDQ